MLAELARGRPPPMPLPARSRHRVARPAAVAFVALVGAAGIGCSSSTPAAVDTSTPTTAGGTTPGTGSTYEIVPDAVVTAGLAEVRKDAAAIKAAQTTDPAST